MTGADKEGRGDGELTQHGEGELGGRGEALVEGEDCGRLVAELVQDRLIDPSVFSNARGSHLTDGLYQILNPLAACNADEDIGEEGEEDEG